MSAAVLAAVAAVVCALSLYIVWYGDALKYQYSFATGEHIRSLIDIPASQYRHFFDANGRIVAHSMVQVFCGLTGQTVFAVCNALAYVCLILLLIKYAGGNWRNWRMTLAAGLLTLFFCDTSYIPPHQIGYIWMSCTAVAFLIVYDRQSDTEKAGLGKCVLLLLIGVICGNGNEAIDLGIGVAIFIDVFRRGHSCGRGRLMLLAGFCIGLCFLCLSPGIVNRANVTYRSQPMMSLYTLVVSFRAFWMFVLVLAIACIRHKVRLRAFVADNWLLLTAMGVMLVFNLAITVKLNRQLFGIELCSVVLTLRLLSHFRISVLWLLAGTVVVAGQYYMKFTTLAYFNSYEKELRRHLTERGNTQLYIDLLHHNPYVHPTEEFSFHDCPNINFHAICCAIDINGGFDCARSLVGKPRLTVDRVALYPTALAEIEKEKPRNRVVCCGDDVYMLLRLKSDPAHFTLHRSFEFLGFSYPLSPIDVSFDASQHPSTDTYDVFVTTFPYPLMRVDSVTVSR